MSESSTPDGMYIHINRLAQPQPRVTFFAFRHLRPVGMIYRSSATCVVIHSPSDVCPGCCVIAYARHLNWHCSQESRVHAHVSNTVCRLTTLSNAAGGEKLVLRMSAKLSQRPSHPAVRQHRKVYFADKRNFRRVRFFSSYS